MSAVNDIKLLSEAILHFDEEGLNKFNISREELVGQWTGSFMQMIGDITNKMFNKNQMLQISNALLNSLYKVQISVQPSYEEAKVEVTVGGLDFSKEFSQKELPINVDKNAKPEEVVAALVVAIQKKFDNMKVSNKSTFLVECELDSQVNVWVPKNFQSFLNILSSAAIGN